MKHILFLFLIAIGSSCASKPSNEMEEICHDVMNKNRGVSITFEPVETKK